MRPGLWCDMPSIHKRSVIGGLLMGVLLGGGAVGYWLLVHGVSPEHLPAPVSRLRGQPRAPKALPQEFVLRFHDAVWASICQYLSAETGSEKANRVAREKMRNRIKQAKEAILQEAAKRYRDGAKRREDWSEQLDEEEDAVWKKADILGEREQPREARGPER